MSDDKYTDRGHRGEDPREGFGDDMGTRIGRPDGAREAPHDASHGTQPGQPGTNAEPVAAGIEGSIMSGDAREGAEGDAQRRVRDASDAENEHVNPDRAAGDDRRVFDL